MKNTTEYLYRKPKTAIVLLLIAVMNVTTVFAQQDMYLTTTGQLIIKAHLNDKAVDIVSKDLIIMLDYETGKVVMKQKISALIINNDSIQSKFQNMQDDYIRFEGKLGLDYINTSGHPPLDFAVEGTIYPGNKYVIGKGHLVHLVQGTANACLLSLSFTLQPGDIFPDYRQTDKNDEIHVQVIQSLLARENE
ncbi:MAG: hypothetical protein L3J31_00440 [Bacteroidales bacterium]|nr:hypothetical protein [Bacteroidales bacterium]MCF6341258.1 hypothetical protein [Bacteroidales bacterium]